MWIIRAALKSPYAVAVMALLILVIGVVSISRIAVDILPVFKAPGGAGDDLLRRDAHRFGREDDHQPHRTLDESGDRLPASRVEIDARRQRRPPLLSGRHRPQRRRSRRSTRWPWARLPTLPPNTLPPVVLPFDPTGTLPLGILTRQQPAEFWPGRNGAQRSGPHRYPQHARRRARRGRAGRVRRQGPHDPDLRRSRRNCRPGGCRRWTWSTPCSGRTSWSRPAWPSSAATSSNSTPTRWSTRCEELNEIPIRTEPGNRVYLRDIGYAKDSHAIQTGLVRINGRRQVYVPIYRQQGASSLTVVDGVRKELPQMMAVLKSEGKNVQLDLVMDQSVYVREAIHSLIHEGVIGALLVAAMILIFLGNCADDADRHACRFRWRSSVRIVGLCVTGNTINAMTLGGLALAIGPLVDDAIVVLENTHRHQALGKSRDHGGLRRRGGGDDSRAGGHADDDHRALSDRADAGHGRISVPAADAGRGLRDAGVVRAVADARAGAVCKVAAAEHDPRRANEHANARLGQADPSSDRTR